MTAPRPWLRGLLAPLLAVAALPVGALFVCSCREQDASPVVAWEVATLLGLLVSLRMRRFRDRPGAAAGIFGVVGWLLAVGVLSMAERGSDLPLAGWLAVGLLGAMGAAATAERPSVMRDTAPPSRHVAGLTALIVLAAVLGAMHVAARGQTTDAQIPRHVGTVEVAVLPSLARERLPAAGGAEPLEVEISTDLGSAEASLYLARASTEPGYATRTARPCTFELPPLGRTVEILATDSAYVVRWPVSPHGESFASCAFDRASLLPVEDASAHSGGGFAWPLALAPVFGLWVLALAWPLRCGHARIARSPELRVTAPGLAVMPDGSPAVVPAEVPMGSTLVALRISDLSADYRSDARISVDEHALGEKPTLLVDLARRIRTLELLALGGTLLLVSTTLVSALVGTPPTF